MAKKQLDAKEVSYLYTNSPDEACSLLGVNVGTGLSDAQVKEQLAKYGSNELERDPPTPLWKLILKQFEDKLVIILVLAALVSFVLAFFEHGDEQTAAFFEPLVIFLILIANATVGVLQESSAEEAVEALKEFESPKAAVFRNGKMENIPAAEIVIGDIVDVEAGDMIPADLRILEIKSSGLSVAQALLTGESEDVRKDVRVISDRGAVAQDKVNMLFAGTTVTRGKARALVIGVGLNTEKGKIQKSLTEQSEVKTPLQERLDKFGDQLTWSIGIICAVVWLINIQHFNDAAFDNNYLKGAIYYFKISVSLAVAAIPEGLPAVVTTCLALGTQRMAKKNAIVTDLPAVETLGCTSVICSDKTGTLTTNQMCVQRFFVVNTNDGLQEYTVEGNSYATFKANKSSFGCQPAVSNSPAKNITRVSMISSLCNESSIIYSEAKGFERVGQATEAALKAFAEKLPVPDATIMSSLAGLSTNDRVMACNAYWEKSFTKEFILEFHRDRKSMSVLLNRSDSGSSKLLLIKGAWDNVLSRCKHVLINDKEVELTDSLRAIISAKATEYCDGENAYRCLSLAYKNVTTTAQQLSALDLPQFAHTEADAVFVGVVGIIDPPRDEVADAVQVCRGAGIRVIMITGDNKNTAVSICRKIGILRPGESAEGKAFTGREFKEMTKEQRKAAVIDARCFARVEPIDKKELVEALHSHKKIVAMTGDGVNDAPALKEADIGIAMGSGTAVAKGAAKMVLQDDNFTTIVAAVEEGRNIYNNTKQFIRYLITSNIGEVVSIFLTAVTGLPEVLLPVQLLWVNLVTDGLPAVALGFNRAEPGIMDQDPRPSDEPIVGGYTFFRYMIQGTYIGIATVLGMIWWFTMYPGGPLIHLNDLFSWATCTADSHPAIGNPFWATNPCAMFSDYSPNTMSLSVLVTIEMFQAINSLSERQSLLSSSSHPFSNLYLICAMCLSFGLHFVILYVPFLAEIFSVEPLNADEWKVVVLLALPVIFLDEVMKFFDRVRVSRAKSLKLRS